MRHDGSPGLLHAASVGNADIVVLMKLWRVCKGVCVTYCDISDVCHLGG